MSSFQSKHVFSPTALPCQYTMYATKAKQNDQKNVLKIKTQKFSKGCSKLVKNKKVTKNLSNQNTHRKINTKND